MTDIKKTTESKQAGQDNSIMVGAIDIGSNSIRMELAQVFADGSFEVMERLQRAVHLGQDTFRKGKLGGSTIRAAVSILRDFRNVLDLYDVSRLRAVATSAVREAANEDIFRDRILTATGIDVAIIDTSEESRLTVSAVRNALKDHKILTRSDTLIAEVGGGSTLLTLLRKGQILTSQSLRLGSIRLQESLLASNDPSDRYASLLQHQIRSTVSAVQSSLPLNEIKTFIAMGADARFAAKQVGRRVESDNIHRIESEMLSKIIESSLKNSTEELARIHALPFAEAETLKPALLICREILNATDAKEMFVSGVSMRDGLLMDLARSVTGREDETISKEIVNSAMSLARKYHIDLSHAGHVSRLAVRLFDELIDEHRLKRRERLLLWVAATLHEVGTFVSSRAHHKLSFYLLDNSEIFGLTRQERSIVAHVARYHRRACPKSSHIEYMTLPRETRIVISKLAAILRVADALDRGHAQQIVDFTCESRDEHFVIRVHGVSDLTLERRAIDIKGDLFEDFYGMRIQLEEAPIVDTDERRARAVE